MTSVGCGVSSTVSRGTSVGLGQDSAWYGALVEGHASSSARHVCLTPGPSSATLLSEMGVHTAAGGRSRPHWHAVAPAAPARAAKPRARGPLNGVTVVISAVGEGVKCMARPPSRAARQRRGPAGARVMAIPSGAHRGTGEWWSAARAWAAAGPWRRVRGWWSAPNGRVAVTLALLLGSERNQGWRAVRRGHADDAAAWFVSFGRVWRAPTPSVPSTRSRSATAAAIPRTRRIENLKR